MISQPLSQVAGQMATYASHNPILDRPVRIPTPYRHILPGGLHVAMWLDHTNWHLSLIRKAKKPSAAEVATIRKYFAVPEHAASTGVIQETVRSNAGTPHRYYLVRLLWPHKLKITQAR